MDDMPPKHAIPAPETRRRDHLWVLVIVAACAGLDICSAWVTIGSISRFQVLFGKFPTDWTLAVIAEAYWGYALFCWLAGASGPRSRRFAKWSAALVFGLSLTCQAAAHLMRPGAPPSEALVIFASCLPAIVLAAIAFLIHLRQADREDAAALAAEHAEATENTELRRKLADVTARAEAAVSAMRTELDGAVSDRNAAQRALAEALARAEALNARLAAVSERKRPGKPASGKGKTVQATAADGDLTTELLAYMELKDNPELRLPRLGGVLARKLGVSGATARRYREKFLNPDGSLRELPADPIAGSLTEPLGERPE